MLTVQIPIADGVDPDAALDAAGDALLDQLAAAWAAPADPEGNVDAA